MNVKICFAALIFTFRIPSGIAQERRPEFEVASIKPSAPGEQGSFQWLPGGRLSASKATVMNLINYAFEMPAQQVIDPPAWLTSERFDISAKGEEQVDRGTDGNRHATQAMLQVLLEQRFALKFHRATQDRPVYALVVRKSGPKLEPNAGKHFEIIRHGRHQIICQKVTMARFAQALSGPYHSDELDRPVVDRTELPGEFDFTLEWAPEFVSQGRAFKSSQSLGGPSVFTAMEALGLQLKAEKAPVDVLVIDHVERPSEN